MREHKELRQPCEALGILRKGVVNFPVINTSSGKWPVLKGLKFGQVHQSLPRLCALRLPVAPCTHSGPPLDAPRGLGFPRWLGSRLWIRGRLWTRPLRRLYRFWRSRFSWSHQLKKNELQKHYLLQSLAVRSCTQTQEGVAANISQRHYPKSYLL